MEIIIGKRYGFYLEKNPDNNFITALYTGENDKINGNLIFINNGLSYSIPKENVIEIKKQ